MTQHSQNGEGLFRAFMAGDVSRLTVTALPEEWHNMQPSYQQAWNDLAASLTAREPATADVGREDLALTKAVRFTAYNRADPLAIRFEFADDADRLEAADEIDLILSGAFAQARARMVEVLAEARQSRSGPIKVRALSRAVPSSEPVAWCSPGQLANLTEVDADGGVYLPIRKTERGNFIMPLYAAPSSGHAMAEGERDRYANDAAAKTLYDSWSGKPGWVSWVERGNSGMQERARREAATPWRWWAGREKGEYCLSGPCQTQQEAINLAYGDTAPGDVIYLVEAIAEDEADEDGVHAFVEQRNHGHVVRGDDATPPTTNDTTVKDEEYIPSGEGERFSTRRNDPTEEINTKTAEFECDWFARHADRRNPDAAVNTNPIYFADECAAAIANGTLTLATTPPTTNDAIPAGDTVAFVQEWLMNADYDPSQFDRDFAAAIDARVVAASAGDLATLFCAAPLPDDVCADQCATVQGPGRTGTNLLTVDQATRVFTAALSAAPSAPATPKPSPTPKGAK